MAEAAVLSDDQVGIPENVVEEHAQVAVLAADAWVQELDRAHVNGFQVRDARLAGMAHRPFDASGEIACEPVLQQALALLVVLDSLEVVRRCVTISTRSSGCSVFLVVEVIGRPLVRTRTRKRANACSKMTLLASIGMAVDPRKAL